MTPLCGQQGRRRIEFGGHSPITNKCSTGTCYAPSYPGTSVVPAFLFKSSDKIFKYQDNTDGFPCKFCEVFMVSLPSSSSKLIRQPLIDRLDSKHPLETQANLIGWPLYMQSCGAHFASMRGRSALLPQQVAGLLHLLPAMRRETQSPAADAAAAVLCPGSAGLPGANRRSASCQRADHQALRMKFRQVHVPSKPIRLRTSNTAVGPRYDLN